MISWRKGPVLPALLFLFCCALYALSLDKAPHFDELYHVLAAQGFQATGEYAIAEGFYTRGWPFTRTVAALFDLFGPGLWVARLPSVLCVAIMAAILFIWIRREAGTLTAGVAAGLFAVSPFAIEIAQFARFYSIHGLAFLVGTLLVYDLVTRPGSMLSFGLRAVGAVVALLVAMFFQVTTFIGLVALASWVVLYLFGPWFLRREVPARRRLAVLAGLLLLGLLVLAGAIGTGLFADALRTFRATPLWAESNANDVLFYHVWLVLYYPTLWTLLPVLFVVALVSQPRMTFFAAIMFGIAMILHSLAGAKGLRYVFYVMPFLFVVWGIGLAAGLRRLWRYFKDHAGVVFARLLPGRHVSGLVTLVVVLAGIWLVASNAASVRSALLLADVTIPPERPAPRWDLAKPILQPLMEEADVVLVTSELDTLYYLGSYDILISKSRMRERAGQIDVAKAPEFSKDTRTGRALIEEPESIDRLMACFQRGLIITSIYRWRHDPMLNDAVADVIVRRARPVELPKGSRVMAFTWDNEAASDGQDCPDLDRPAGKAPTS